MQENIGKVLIAPNVLITIVQKTAAGTPGVARLSDRMPGVKRLLGLQSVGEGVQIHVVDDEVAVDVYLVARRNVDMLTMSRELQRAVTRAIQDIVGKNVREVNVHIEDVATDLPATISAKRGSVA